MHEIGVGFFVGAGIPKGPRVNTCKRCEQRPRAANEEFCAICRRVLDGQWRQSRKPRANTFVECGCCGAYHRTDFNGDCREDSERHYDLPDNAEIVYADECEECGHPYKDGDETHYPGCEQIEVN